MATLRYAGKSILVAAVAALLVAGLALAGPPAQAPAGPHANPAGAPVAGRMSYQGRLTDNAGNPLNGSYNLVFQLWDDPAAGSQLGSDIPKPGTPVDHGLFTVQLDVPPVAFDGQGVWLRIQVNGQWLSPRQELLPVPYAFSLRPGALVSGSDDFSASLNVSNGGTAPAIFANAGAMLFDLPRSRIGVFGAGRDAGVMGFAGGAEAAGGVFNGDIGVKGSGQNGPGGEFSSVHGAGVYASAEAGHAVHASSSADVGVYATAGTVPAILIIGHQAVVAYGQDNGVIAWGGQTGGTFDGTIGVHGKTSGSNGDAGVYGESTDMLKDGVSGKGFVGVRGIGTAAGVHGEGVDVGVSGEGNVGLSGRSAAYDGVGVGGEAVYGTGVYGSGETGVKGISSVGQGVRGEGSTGVGGYGSATGVYGEATTGSGTGVAGSGGTFGVAGTTAGTAAVRGTHSASGNFADLGTAAFGAHAVAFSQDGIGLVAQSTTGDAVRAETSAAARAGVFAKNSGDGDGVYAESQHTALHAWSWQGSGNEEAALRAENYNANHGMAARLVNSSDYHTAHVQNTGSGGVLFLRNNGDATGAGGYDFVTAINRDGSPKFRVLSSGEVLSDVGFHTPAQDFAELLPGAAGLGPGDVLVIGDDGQLARSTRPYATAVAGVYSTRPGFVGGASTSADAAGSVPLAMVGIVPVKVSAENGAIRPGDLLVTSATPGYAMKAGPNPPQGTVVGKALERLDAGTGVVKMLATLQ